MNDDSFITGNVKVVRSINRAMILNLIRTKQPIPRTEIAKITGLNKSTVSSIVSSLLQEDLIYEELTNDQNVGRSPVNLFLSKNRYHAGAINIDAETTSLAVVDIDGGIKGTSALRTDAGNMKAFLEVCTKEIRRLCNENNVEALEGIGITMGGIVDSNGPVISFSPGLPWENINIREVISRGWPELKIISIGNDAKSSALAELWFGSAAVRLSSFVLVSIGSNISSGIVIDDRLLEGGARASGEFGHITIIEGGKVCECGNRGCWEIYASDRATLKRYGEKASSKEVRREEVSLQRIITLAEEGDPFAVSTLKETGYYLGLGITNIILSIDPEAVILSGGITRAWSIIYPEIMKVVKERTSSGRERNIEILPSSLSERSRLLGAATLVIKEIFDYYRIT